MNRLPSFVIGLFGAVVGTLLVVVLLHLYLDHVGLHEIQTYLLQNAGKISKLP
jgi:hypothetical protein